jgi:hypothetical protein
MVRKFGAKALVFLFYAWRVGWCGILPLGGGFRAAERFYL